MKSQSPTKGNRAPPARLRSLLTAIAWAWLLGLGLSAAGLATADDRILPDDQRTNGSETLQVVAPVKARAAQWLVTLGVSKDSPELSGTIVAPDGYVLTKASEAVQITPLRVILSDGSLVPARVVKRDDRLDLMLLKIAREALPAVTWSASTALAPAQWLCAFAGGAQEMRLGVVSARRRPVPSTGAVMGILMARETAREGVIIDHVAEESPAEMAGLQDKDILLAVNGHRVDRRETVRKLLSKSRPSDLVKIRYLRDGQETEVQVRLASRGRVEMAPEDFANHGTSTRTDDFPEVIQHDMPLGPADMGSPVYDLHGQAVGLNIARVDRVTNFALPEEVFREKVQSWILADRGRKRD